MKARFKSWLIITLLFVATLVAFTFLFIPTTEGVFGSVCGMAVGPCEGKKVALPKIKDRKAHFADCPNGRIGFIEGRGEHLPVLFKKDANGNLFWAYQFDTESSCGIPLMAISGLELQQLNGAPVLRFFNKTYSEPGIIYLTSDYNFDCLCLSPM
ncbi:MAG TPA: hypothetical protein VK168_15590 [Saprospiraceae bacterium]|nr:hypothetical protein [Saprospiraceae bacterium]